MTATGVASAQHGAHMTLAEALSLGSAVWEAVQARAESPSPFMSWTWHRAWADAVGGAGSDVAACEALAVHDAEGVHAILPLRRQTIPFHRVPVTALTWAIGDMGCPDNLDVLATSEADV